MSEDSMHRTLNAALARNSGPSAEDVGDPTLTVPDVNALTGDDIESWLTNPFMSPDMIAEKVCWWVTLAEARGAERGARAVVEALRSGMPAPAFDGRYRDGYASGIFTAERAARAAAEQTGESDA